MKMKTFWKLFIFQKHLPLVFPLVTQPTPHPRHWTRVGQPERKALKGLQPIKGSGATLWKSAAHKTKQGVCNLARCLLADLSSSILATASGKGAEGEKKHRLTLGSLHHHPAPTYHCISHPYCLHIAINVSGGPFKVHLHSEPYPWGLIDVSTAVLPPRPLGLPQFASLWSSLKGTSVIGINLGHFDRHDKKTEPKFHTE